MGLARSQLLQKSPSVGQMSAGAAGDVDVNRHRHPPNSLGHWESGKTTGENLVPQHGSARSCECKANPAQVQQPEI